jgi:hypothetical protein
LLIRLSRIRALCIFHLILLDLTVLIIFGLEDSALVNLSVGLVREFLKFYVRDSLIHVILLEKLLVSQLVRTLFSLQNTKVNTSFHNSPPQELI